MLKKHHARSQSYKRINLTVSVTEVVQDTADPRSKRTGLKISLVTCRKDLDDMILDALLRSAESKGKIS